MPSWRDRAKKVDGTGGSWRDRAKTDEQSAAEVEQRRKELEQKPGMIESGIRGAAQGLWQDFADEISASAGAGIDVAKASLGLRGDIDYGDAYRTNRNAIRRRDEQAQAANPKTFTGAKIAGGVASTLAPGGAVLNAGKGAKMATVVGKGAMQGGLVGLGSSEAELSDGSGIPEALADTGKGAIIGGLTAGAFKKVGDNFSPEALKRKADARFYKGAVGRQAGFDKKLTDEQRLALGRYLRDKVGVKGGDAPKNILKKLKDQKAAMGQQYDEIYKEFGDAQIVDGANIATKIRKLAEEIKSPNSTHSSAYNNLLKQADDFEAMGYLPMGEAKRLRGTYKFELGDPGSMSLGRANTQRINKIIGEEMDSGVAALDKQRLAGGDMPAGVRSVDATDAAQIGGDAAAEANKGTINLVNKGGSWEIPKELLQRFRNLQKNYGQNKTMMAPTKELAERFERNRTLGLTDYMTGLGTFAAGGEPITAAALAVGNRVARERGSTALAATMDRLANGLAKTPEAFGPFYPILAKAASRGAGSLAATHYMLSKKHPEYRELLKRQEAERNK